jgi:hypothetical protein
MKKILMTNRMLQTEYNAVCNFLHTNILWTMLLMCDEKKKRRQTVKERIKSVKIASGESLLAQYARKIR